MQTTTEEEEKEEEEKMKHQIRKSAQAVAADSSAHCSDSGKGPAKKTALTADKRKEEEEAHSRIEKLYRGILAL